MHGILKPLLFFPFNKVCEFNEILVNSRGTQGWYIHGAHYWYTASIMSTRAVTLLKLVFVWLIMLRCMVCTHNPKPERYYINEKDAK